LSFTKCVDDRLELFRDAQAASSMLTMQELKFDTKILQFLC
jgi:hypothetical protein